MSSRAKVRKAVVLKTMSGALAKQLNEMGVKNLRHLRRHSTEGHPRGDTERRCNSGAITHRRYGDVVETIKKIVPRKNAPIRR